MENVPQISLFTAFLAGLASFLSPCVLPLIPGYLSFISGISIEEMTRGRGTHVRHVLLHSLLFVIGFSAVFVAMGAVATAVGAFIQGKLVWFNRAAGLLVIFFGLQMMGVWRLRFLMSERRYHGMTGGGWVGTVLLGMAFAFGWSPCVGPILFSVLACASTAATVGRGVALLASYSAGIGIPFLLIGLGVGSFLRLLDRWQRYLRWVEAGSGLLLVVIGVLMLTGSLGRIFDSLSRGW